MLWTIFLALVMLWLLGVIGQVGGAFVHVILVLALVIFLVELLVARRIAL